MLVHKALTPRAPARDLVWIKPYKIEDLVAKIEAHVEAMAAQQ